MFVTVQQQFFSDATYNGVCVLCRELIKDCIVFEFKVPMAMCFDSL